MVQTATCSAEDRWLVSLACSLKGLKADHVQSETDSLPVLAWEDGTVTGAAAIILYLEASITDPSLFPNGNMGMPLALLHWRDTMKSSDKSDDSKLEANAQLITRQLADGRLFLQGSQPGLADICCASWLMPRRASLGNEHPLQPWLRRITKMGQRPVSAGDHLLLKRHALAEKAGYSALLIVRNGNGEKLFVTSPLDEQPT